MSRVERKIRRAHPASPRGLLLIDAPTREYSRTLRRARRWMLTFLAVAEPIVYGWVLALPLCAMVVLLWGGR